MQGPSPSTQRLTRTIVDELEAAAPGDRRYDELIELGHELRGHLGNLVRRVRTTDHPLSSREDVSEARKAADEVIAAAESDAGALAALDIEADLIDLIGIDARLRVAEVLQGAAVRATAEAAGLTPGYVSELRAGKKQGLPSLDASARLDQVVPSGPHEETIHEIVRAARETVGRLREQRSAREGETVVAGLPIPKDLRGKARLEDVAERLRTDDAALSMVEGMLSLPDRERRAVATLIQELHAR